MNLFLKCMTGIFVSFWPFLPFDHFYRLTICERLWPFLDHFWLSNKVFGHFLTVFDCFLAVFGRFWRLLAFFVFAVFFGPILSVFFWHFLAVVDSCWPILTVFDHIWQFLTIFDCFCALLTVLDRFGPLLTVLDRFDD